MDDATGEGLVQSVDAEDEIELFAKALEVGRVFVQTAPDALGKDFRIVILVKKFLEKVEEFGNDAMGAFRLPQLVNGHIRPG